MCREMKKMKLTRKKKTMTCREMNIHHIALRPAFFPELHQIRYGVKTRACEHDSGRREEEWTHNIIKSVDVLH